MSKLTCPQEGMPAACVSANRSIRRQPFDPRCDFYIGNVITSQVNTIELELAFLVRVAIGVSMSYNAATNQEFVPPAARRTKREEMIMRMKLIGTAIFGLAAIAMAQTPVSPDLHLRGDRFKPLTYAELNPQQKALADDVLAGDRGTLNGPYNVFLRSPEMGDLAQKFGDYTRFHSAVPKKLNEFAIIITARYWNSQYEWLAHRKYASDAGLSPEVIEAVATGKRPTTMKPDEEAVYNFCTEMLDTKQVSDDTFAAAKSKLGEQGVVDLVAVMGCYHLVSMTLNLDRYPLPEGAKPELKPLSK